MKLVTLSLGLSLSLIACGKSEGGGGGGGKVASCNLASMKMCVQYNDGNLALGTEHVAKLCTVVSKEAVFTETACPAADQIGSCQRNEGKDVYYKDNPLGDAATLEKSCAGRGGTWSK